VRSDLNKSVAEASELMRSAAITAAAAAAEVGGGCCDDDPVAAAAATALRATRNRLSAVIAEARELGLDEDEIRPAEWQRRRLHNLIQDMQGQVRVYCRVRPLSSQERRLGDAEALRVLRGTAIEVDGFDRGSLGFDSVFSPGTQDTIFHECKDLVQSAIDGHNVTVLCYGQTGAGKTYTMYGNPKEPGLAVRMVRELFHRLGGLHHAVTGSLVELHNNRLTDLLAPTAAGDGDMRPALNLRRDPEAEVQVEGLVEQPLHGIQDLKALVELGTERRATSAHALNSDSSRSHVLLTVKIHRRVEGSSGIDAGLAGLPPCSKLVFCDLGGSERLKRTEAAGGQVREAIEINKSLSALGDVIEAVVQRRRHIPYRNHKLTQLLQDSLGGSAKALMFVNCSPAASSAAETVAALKFAARAKSVVNSCTMASQGRAALVPKYW